MKHLRNSKWFPVILCIVLIAAVALCASGCSQDDSKETLDTTVAAGPATVLGEGSTVFHVIVVDLEGKQTAFEVHTDATIVGEALQAVKLLEGEAGPYGLYIKAVNGIPLDYDKDGKYWAVYIDGEYAMTGVDAIEITAGATYTFQPEA